MLIEFSVENYKCFATQQTLNMRPDPDIQSLDENLIRTGLTQENGEELILLPTVAIYGANASGKSNLLEAFFASKNEGSLGGKLLKTTFFNNNFTINCNLTELTLFVSADDLPKPNKIFDGKLNYQPSICEFSPKVDSVTTIEGIQDWLLVEDFNIQPLCMKNDKALHEHFGFKNIYYWNSNSRGNYKGNVYHRFVYFLNDILDQSLPNSKGVFESKHDEPIPLMATLDDPERKEKLKQLLRKADFNIEDITVHKAQSGKNKTLYTLEFKIRGQEETLWYNDQSEGTKRFLLMMPTIVHVLETGAILLADELEQHLHPDLCKAIVELFNSRETNPHGSQLIFTTHNFEWMDAGMMRPDQVYFINKDEETGASDLYRASDFGEAEGIDWQDPKTEILPLYEMGTFSATPKIWGLK